LEIALNKDLSSVSSRKQWLQHVTGLVLQYCVSEPGLPLDRKSSARSAAVGAG
jgi:hypothetical protein